MATSRLPFGTRSVMSPTGMMLPLSVAYLPGYHAIFTRGAKPTRSRVHFKMYASCSLGVLKRVFFGYTID